MSSRWLSIVCVAVLATGVCFRIINLDRKVLWNDEVWTSLRILGHQPGEVLDLFDGHEIGVEDLRRFQRINPARPTIDALNPLDVQDPEHPPLYYLVSRLFVELFGPSIAAIRSVSVLFSLIAFPCLYWLCRELFEDRHTAWVAMALMAVSPFHVLYAQEARSYSLWTLTILMSSAALLRAMRLQTTRSWWMYAATVAIGFYAHLLFALVVAAHAAYVTGLSLPDITAARMERWHVVTRYARATLIGLLAFAPWAAIIVLKLSQSLDNTSWITNKVDLSDLVNEWVFNFGSVFLDTGGSPYGIGSPWIDRASYVILTVAAFAVYVLCRRTPKRTWLFVLTLTASAFVLLAVPDLVWGGRRSSAARFWIPSYVGVALAVAHLLATQMMAASVVRRRLSRSFTAALVACGIVSCAISAQADVWWNKAGSHQVPAVAQILNRSAHPLAISDRYALNPWNVVSLGYRLNPHVRFRLVVDPQLPTIPDGFSDVYLIHPSEALRRGLAGREGRPVTPVYESELWRLGS